MAKSQKHISEKLRKTENDNLKKQPKGEPAAELLFEETDKKKKIVEAVDENMRAVKKMNE